MISLNHGTAVESFLRGSTENVNRGVSVRVGQLPGRRKQPSICEKAPIQTEPGDGPPFPTRLRDSPAFACTGKRGLRDSDAGRILGTRIVRFPPTARYRLCLEPTDSFVPASRSLSTQIRSKSTTAPRKPLEMTLQGGGLCPVVGRTTRGGMPLPGACWCGLSIRTDFLFLQPRPAVADFSISPTPSETRLVTPLVIS